MGVQIKYPKWAPWYCKHTSEKAGITKSGITSAILVKSTHKSSCIRPCQFTRHPESGKLVLSTLCYWRSNKLPQMSSLVLRAHFDPADKKLSVCWTQILMKPSFWLVLDKLQSKLSLTQYLSAFVWSRTLPAGSKCGFQYQGAHLG